MTLWREVARLLSVALFIILDNEDGYKILCVQYACARVRTTHKFVWWIWIKFCGSISYGPRTNWIDFVFPVRGIGKLIWDPHVRSWRKSTKFGTISRRGDAKSFYECRASAPSTRDYCVWGALLLGKMRSIECPILWSPDCCLPEDQGLANVLPIGNIRCGKKVIP